MPFNNHHIEPTSGSISSTSMHINKTTGTGSLERRSRGENTNAESMQGGPNVINRGGNILINEFL